MLLTVESKVTNRSSKLLLENRIPNGAATSYRGRIESGFSSATRVLAATKKEINIVKKKVRT